MTQRREGTGLGTKVVYGHLEEVIVKDLEEKDREAGLSSQGDKRPCPQQIRHLLRMMSAHHQSTHGFLRLGAGGVTCVGELVCAGR